MAEFDDLLDGTDSDPELVRTLRKALKERDKEFKEIQAQLAERAKTDRTRSLADVLKEKGVPDKVAKLYPEHAEVTADAVDSWLSEYGDVFGIEQHSGTADAATVEAARRISDSSAGAAPGHVSIDIQSLTAEIASAKTPEQYEAAMAKLGMK